MNKLKLMYDVVKTLKEKEEIKGSLQVKGEKNQTQIFSFANDFARNLQTGETKAKISTMYDCGGNQVKHESYTEFNLQDKPKHPMFPGFKGHMHHHGTMHHHGHGPCPKTVDPKNHGFKDKLNKIACVLNILQQIAIAEQEDKSLLLTFSSDNMPAEMQQAFREKMQRHHGFPEPAEGHHKFMQEFGHITTSSIEVSVRINQNREVERVALNVVGQGDTQEKPTLSLTGELNLLW